MFSFLISFNLEFLKTWRFNRMTEHLLWSAFSALLVRDCKLLLRKRLADSGGEALHQQALKRLQRFARSRLQAFAAQKTCGLRWGSFTSTSLEAPSALLVFFLRWRTKASFRVAHKKSPDAVHQGCLVVARERLELSASGLWIRRSNQLSYLAISWGANINTANIFESLFLDFKTRRW